MSELDYLNARDRPAYREGVTNRDIFLNSAFIKMWMFLYTYGERYYLSPNFQDKVKIINEGQCIRHSLARVKLCRELQSKKAKFNKLVNHHYVEGLTNYAPLSLHAWIGIETSRHLIAIEETRNIDNCDIWYQGVKFEKEFFDDVWNFQKKNDGKYSLPYLCTGYSVLTFEPLLNGNVKEYPFRHDLMDEAIKELLKFITRKPKDE